MEYKEQVKTLFNLLSQEELNFAAIKELVSEMPRYPRWLPMQEAQTMEDFEKAVHKCRARGGPIPQNLVWSSMHFLGQDPFPWMRKKT